MSKKMPILDMEKIIDTVDDETVIQIYRGRDLIAKGKWYCDQILKYIRERAVKVDFDGISNICNVTLGEGEEHE